MFKSSQKRTIRIPLEKLKVWYAQMRQPKKYGLCKEEIVFSHTAEYDDGALIVVTGRTCNTIEELGQLQVMFCTKDGANIDISEDYPDIMVAGDFTAEDDGTEYTLRIWPEHCTIPLKHTNRFGNEDTVYFDSDWLMENGQEFFEEYGGFIGFLETEYTSDDTNQLLGDALLAGAILFYTDTDIEGGFGFPNKDEWKYRAFVEALKK